MNPLAIFSILRASWVWIVMGVLLAALGVQTMRLDHAHTELAQIQAQYAEEREKAADATAAAEADARSEEERREQRKQEIVDEAEHQTELAKASAAAAATSADGLRKQLAVFVANARQAPSNPGSAKGSTPASTALDLLAQLLNRSSEVQQELAGFADQSRIAGLACEQAYNGLRATP